MVVADILLLYARRSWRAAVTLRRARRILWALVAIAIAISTGLALTTGRGGELPRGRTASVALDQNSPLVGKRLPGLHLTDLDGHPVSVDRLRGRPVLLNYWATWCIPCRAEMPEIQHEASVWGAKVAIVGVDDGEDSATISSFIRDIGVTYTIWRDPTGEVERLLKAPGLPFTIFLDREGTVRRVFLGQMTRDYIDARLREVAR